MANDSITKTLCTMLSCGGSFHSTYAGVLFVGREDGVLEVWDLLDRSHEPVLMATPSAAAITSLAFSPSSTSSGSSARPVRQLLALGAGPADHGPRVPRVLPTASHCSGICDVMYEHAATTMRS